MYFKIQWEDEGFQDCKTPLEAAKQALANLQNGETLCFTVISKDHEVFSVDLSEDDDEAVVQITDINELNMYHGDE